jgi:hypothetical protein
MTRLQNPGKSGLHIASEKTIGEEGQGVWEIRDEELLLGPLRFLVLEEHNIADISKQR